MKAFAAWVARCGGLAGTVGALSLCITTGVAAQGASDPGAPVVTLTRLECGSEREPAPVALFSDTYAYPDLKLPLTYGCYLIRHGDDYMIWDAGLPTGAGAGAPTRSLVQVLAELNVTPEQVKYLAISHYHYDHIGQAASFPHSTLLIGKGDWDVLSADDRPPGMDAEEFASRRVVFAPWLSGGAALDSLDRDKDVFGDGTVVMLSTPGHTPGHHSLLVRLRTMGYVLLSGDIAHFHENYVSDGVPTWNFNRADSLASLDRFKKIASNLKATVIIQHDPRDIDKLPAFPAAAE